MGLGIKRDDDLCPALQVFQPNRTVRISGLQDLRALQGDVLLIAIGSRYTVYGNLELRSRHCGWSWPGCGKGNSVLFACQLLSRTSIAASRVASKPCHGWRRLPREG